MSVTDRFLAELAPISNGQVLKDADVKYENLVKGLRHISIKVSGLKACIDFFKNLTCHSVGLAIRSVRRRG